MKSKLLLLVLLAVALTATATPDSTGTKRKKITAEEPSFTPLDPAAWSGWENMTPFASDQNLKVGRTHFAGIIVKCPSVECPDGFSRVKEITFFVKKMVKVEVDTTDETPNGYIYEPHIVPQRVKVEGYQDSHATGVEYYYSKMSGSHGITKNGYTTYYYSSYILYDVHRIVTQNADGSKEVEWVVYIGGNAL